MQKSFAGLIVACRTHEAGRSGQLVTGTQGVAAARLYFFAHARPFLEPSCIVAHLIGKGAADAVDLIDLDTGPWRRGQANQ